MMPIADSRQRNDLTDEVKRNGRHSLAKKKMKKEQNQEIVYIYVDKRHIFCALIVFDVCPVFLLKIYYFFIINITTHTHTLCTCLIFFIVFFTKVAKFPVISTPYMCIYVLCMYRSV